MLAADFLGSFALVFAGCGAIMVDAETGARPDLRSLDEPRPLPRPALAAADLSSIWIYLTAPLLGAALGGLAYQLVRGEHPGPAGERGQPA